MGKRMREAGAPGAAAPSARACRVATPARCTTRARNRRRARDSLPRILRVDRPARTTSTAPHRAASAADARTVTAAASSHFAQYLLEPARQRAYGRARTTQRLHARLRHQEATSRYAAPRRRRFLHLPL